MVPRFAHMTTTDRVYKKRFTPPPAPSPPQPLADPRTYFHLIGESISGASGGLTGRAGLRKISRMFWRCFTPRVFIAALVFCAGLNFSCAAGADDYAETIRQSRAEKDAFMRDDPQSPFKREPAVAFAPLKYFPPDSGWVRQSRLQTYPDQQPVTILDTKGRKREGVIYGFLTLTQDGRVFTLRVYRMTSVGGAVYYGVWFTDRTTGDTTYEVGRYLDFEKVDDPDHVYTLDFNLAYNPYCAYTHAYGCAIPRKEDHLDFAITAGEKKWQP